MANNLDEFSSSAQFSDFQKGLTQVINNTFSYANNSLFLAMANQGFRDYLEKYVGVSAQWLDGYVRGFHDNNTGIISTHMANSIIQNLTRQILGEKVYFSKFDSTCSDEDLIKCSRVMSNANMESAIYSLIGYSLAMGTSVIKINKTDDGKIWWETSRVDNCFYRTNFRGECVDATFYIKRYVNTQKSNDNYYVVEHRYYKTIDKPIIYKMSNGTFYAPHKKGDRVAYCQYEVGRVQGMVLNNILPSNIQKGLNWKELPSSIRKAIREDYGVMRINEEMELGLTNIGVEILTNNYQDLGVPTAMFGQSILVSIQSELLSYDYAFSCMVRDMYNGKGIVLIPKNMTMSDGIGRGGELSGLDKNKYETIKGLDPDKQSPIVVQHDLRGEEWKEILNSLLQVIATKIGVPASFLAVPSKQVVRTATEIESTDDLGVGFINSIRENTYRILNRILETTLSYVGIPGNIKISFAMPSIVNKDRLLNRVRIKYDAGFINLRNALKELNPDFDENQINELYSQILNERPETLQNNLLVNKVK